MPVADRLAPRPNAHIGPNTPTPGNTDNIKAHQI